MRAQAKALQKHVQHIPCVSAYYTRRQLISGHVLHGEYLIVEYLIWDQSCSAFRITDSLPETPQIINLLKASTQLLYTSLSTQLPLSPSVLAMSQPACSTWRHHFPWDSRRERRSGHPGPQPSDEGWSLWRSQPGTPTGFAIPPAGKKQPASTSIAQLREPAARRIKYSATTKLTNRQ